MSGKLREKVALITGANSGIGLATAKQFVSEGAYVFITGRRQADLDAATRELGDNSMGIQGDVASLEDLDRLYATVERTRGHLDILFANAGLGEFSPLGEITEAHFNQTFDVNVKGTLFTVQKALPLLRDGSAIIVNVSTAASIGVPSFGVYSATKAALRSFVRTWMLELKDRQIRVNAVSPGPIDTPGVRGLLEGSRQADADRASLIARVPLARMGRPDEVAKAVVFLASNDSSFVNGAELFVDGGSAQR